jgi:DNA polymerase-3 subunit delta'
MFESTPGQAHAKQYFARAFARGLSHAYLLVGDEGLGKAGFARELGVAIVASCGGCGACDECARAARGASPDLTIVEREGEQLRLEQVERLVAELSLRPFAAERRVWVLLEADKMTTEAANKLLKSLEEPPGYVYFVLVSDHVERLLPTIVSRCQTVEFQPAADTEIAAFLSARHGLDAEAAAALARLARGSVERAERLAEDARGAGRRGRYLDLAARAVDGDADGERAFLDEVAKEEQEVADRVADELTLKLQELERTVADPRERSWHQKRLQEASKRDKARRTRLVALDALDHLSSWLRDVWVVTQAAPQAVWNSDRIGALERAAIADRQDYGRRLEVVAATRKDLYLNIDRRLALTAMFRRFEEVAESA